MFPWDDLIKLTEKGWIIPVIGSDVYRTGEKKVYKVIAEQLVGKNAHEKDKHYFQKAAAEFLSTPSQEGQVRYYSDLTDKINNILKSLAFNASSDLLHLAQIEKYKIYINTTYDNFLFDALKRAGRTEVLMLNYTPNEKDLNALDNYKVHLEKRNSVIIFNVFGNISNNKPSYTEKDIIESITDLQGDIRMSNNNLFNKMKNSSYLFIGCNFKNWLLRFIARSITNNPFDPVNAGEQRRFFSSDISSEDPDDTDLRVFLESQPSRFFFQGTTVDFMSSFWNSIKDKPWIVDLHCCFLSFNGKDRHCAESINSFLKEKRIKTWFDGDGERGGNKVDETIQNAIIKSKLFITIASENYINYPGYQDLEFFWLKKFNENERKTDPIKIITIAIGDVDRTKVPPEANTLFWYMIPTCDILETNVNKELTNMANKIIEICEQ